MPVVSESAIQSEGHKFRIRLPKVEPPNGSRTTYMHDLVDMVEKEGALCNFSRLYQQFSQYDFSLDDSRCHAAADRHS